MGPAPAQPVRVLVASDWLWMIMCLKLGHSDQWKLDADASFRNSREMLFQAGGCSYRDEESTESCKWPP